ncbi:MAG: hypothetical protein K8T91_27875 [Planctomycetes bacterium]|nr:hypothetical protein [Planctomycetota bacterium]
MSKRLEYLTSLLLLASALCLLSCLAGCGSGISASSGVRASDVSEPDTTALDTQLKIYEQQTAKLGGDVELKVNLAKSSITDETLSTLPLPENICALDLSSTKITDSGLAHVKKARRLKSLSLVGVPITDAGLTHLRDLPKLEFVDLRHTKVSQPAQWALMKELRQRAYERQQKR